MKAKAWNWVERGRGRYSPVQTITFDRFVSLPVRKLMKTGGRVRGQKMRTHTIEFLRGMSEFAELDQPVEYRQKKEKQ